jgi:hypothetical protein
MTTPDEGVRLTPEQLLARLDEMPDDQRLDFARRMLGASGEAMRCFALDHEGRIAHADDLITVGRWLIAEARWVAMAHSLPLTQADRERLIETFKRWNGGH